MSKVGKFSVIVVLVATIFSPIAQSQLVLDDFSTAQSTTNNTGPSSVTDEIAAAGAIGGVRLIRLTNGSTGTSTGSVAGGTITLSTNVDSDLEVWWDGVDDDGFTAAGLGGTDLTSGGSFDRFQLDVTANTRPTEDMRIQVWQSGSMRCEVIFQMPVGIVEVFFSSLTNCTGGATSTSVTENAGLVLLRTVNRPGAWSFTLNFVQSTPVELQVFSVD